MKFSAKNPCLRVAANRYGQWPLVTDLSIIMTLKIKNFTLLFRNG
jgi:hypothetical protein